MVALVPCMAQFPRWLFVFLALEIFSVNSITAPPCINQPQPTLRLPLSVSPSVCTLEHNLDQLAKVTACQQCVCAHACAHALLFGVCLCVWPSLSIPYILTWALLPLFFF